MGEFVDNDDLDFADPTSVKFEFPGCPGSGRVFKLVRRLANKYRAKAGIDCLPVPTDLITCAGDNLPIEVRRVPLRAYHGAIWRLNDSWVVQLNSNDKPDRQRFTLYHEIFHILAHLAHCKATPVFKKAACSREGSFNELLADHFAAVMLIPPELVRKTWPEVKDISKMATIFEVPGSVMWLGLKRMRLI
jgi:hypothetical protein